MIRLRRRLDRAGQKLDFSPAELARVAAEQEHPRLRVWQSPLLDWWWQVTGPHGEQLDDGVAETHAEALAVGMAALEVASVVPAANNFV